MKHRFNWVFEILRSEFFNAEAVYARGSNPGKDRGELLDRVRRIAATARSHKADFPGEPQYALFLDDAVETLDHFLREAADREDLEPLLRETRQRLATVEDDVRLRLK
jgi:hypothetical protein